MNKRLALLLLLALGSRLLFWYAAGWNPPLAGDEVQYEQLAENLVRGAGFVTDQNPFFPGERLYAWQAPLYPYTLASLYTVTGPNPAAARALQVILGVLTVYVVYDLVRRLWVDPGERRTPEWAALFVALYPGLITNTHLLLSETLFTLLLVLSFALLVRVPHGSSRRIAAAAGLVFGLATLTRGISLYFAPVAALWLVLPLDPTRAKGRSPHVAPALLFLLVFAATLAPWAVRNAYTFGQFELLESKGGVNLWLGNSPYTPAAWIRDVWKVGVREPMLAQLPEGEIARDRAGFALALSHIRREPLTFLARVPVKLADFWGFERNLLDVAEATRRGGAGGWTSAAKISSDVAAAAAYILLMLAAVVGLFLSPGDRNKLLIVALVLYFVALHAVIFGDGRFHLPLVPFLAVYAGWAAAHRAALRGHLAGWRLAAAAFVILGLALIWVREGLAAYQILAG